jgi:inhibitor of cysteine peptidase
VPDSILTEKDNEKEVEASVGTQVRIELPENPTTGYQWKVCDLNGEALALKSDDYVPGHPSAIGGGGIRQFVFEVMSPGETKLCLKNMRAWEGEEAAVKTFAVTILVGK